jgi:hypothetical protein
VAAICGVTAELCIHDGVSEEVEQSAEYQPDADGVSGSTLQEEFSVVSCQLSVVRGVVRAPGT